MYATLTPGFISNFFANFSRLFPAKPKTASLPAAAAPTTPSAETSSFEAAKKRCRLFNSKETAVRSCMEDARRNLERMKREAPPKPKTALQLELARCDTIGKTAVQMACRREAPKRVEILRRAAAEAAADTRTPLEKAIASCRNQHSKMAQAMQCIRDAKKRLSPEK